MWRLAWFVWLASAVAVAGPLPRKGATDKYPLEALLKFTEAIAFERVGAVSSAIVRYQAANELSPQPHTYFNVARLYLEVENIPETLASLEKYLELAPRAADRAAVSQLVAKLQAAKPVITIGSSGLGEEADAFILVDGELIGRSPVKVELAPGYHYFERISATKLGVGEVSIQPYTPDYQDVWGANREEKGNVFISIGTKRDTGVTWGEGKHTFVSGERFSLPVGTYTMTRFAAKSLCTPVQFKVLSRSEVTYVYGSLERSNSGTACDKLRVVRTHQLAFGTQP